MKLILTGATGFTGGEVLRQALIDESIEQITVLTRRSLGLTHAKLREIVREDFLDYTGVDFTGADAAIWALGVSQVGVTEAEYTKITCDYTVAGATAMLAANPALRFCFVSGRNADPTEKSSKLFGRIKGRTERKLSELSERAVQFRPGYIRPTKTSGPRRDLARFFAPIGTLMGLFTPDFSVDCDQLARCLLDVAKQGSSQPVLENAAIRTWRNTDS